MVSKITAYIERIESERGIKVLLATETGSRAWGFPSPDSDYDVRLIYAHPVRWYLSLSEKEDTIDTMLENRDLDVSGWDLRKSLRLLMKSNATLLERIHSPTIYACDEVFLDEVRSVSLNYYSRISAMHHYLNMARNTLAEIDENGPYKLKKLFYALRSATACRWILEKDELSPVAFTDMLNGLDLPATILADIERLREMKSRADESYLHRGETALLDFIHDSLLAAAENGGSLPAGKGRPEICNDLFIHTLERIWTSNI